MAFTSLSANAQAYVTAIVNIGFIAITLAIITNILAKKSIKSTLAISSLLLVLIADLSLLLEILDFSRPYDEVAKHSLNSILNIIPYHFHIVLGLFSSFIAVLSIYKAYQSGKSSINDFSIKEALESLPTGIAFTSNNNDIYLSNNIMYNLCKELIHKDLISGIDLWEELCKLKHSDKCVMNEDNPAFILSNGKIWQFSRTFRKWHTGDYIEIKATEITELYRLRENTKEVGVVLLEQQKRLSSLANIIEKHAEEEIAVNMKVGFHDNFGNLLTLTKELLRESPEMSATKILALHYAKLTDIITDLASDIEHSLSLEQIILFGKKLGCEVIINGDLPTDEEIKTTILLCINEALKNAYRHADADKLTVDILNASETVDVIIHNETKNALSNITEGGGLIGLRQIVEKIGGNFNIYVDNGVRMKITLNKTVL